ncbi:hypothetical protein SAMN02745127_01839 [Oceanospirillum multiglobuliferum]|uniref:Uncharacterized protein n=1 Tax=Oceanospirillum multiglobuliferum TaxID=64969 RepID=A0A1T4QBZ9_9GAMM|nr:hypothetical protein [Oceanospirillum multiglobuliferum]OPX56523.1 hypothetical protein BTE48_03610 [Oceanospirillum multiglobuliferum]SKA01292.1 hypothetical protein SAMN02745127_01839 [Oceanospirillum multiglobuliferum]
MSRHDLIKDIAEDYSTRFFEIGTAVYSIANLLAHSEVDHEAAQLSGNDRLGLIYALRQLGHHTVETTGSFDRDVNSIKGARGKA